MTRPTRLTNTSSLRTAGILIASIAVLYVGREIFIPLALAITLTLVLAPIVAWLERLHLGRAPAALLAIIVSLAAAGGIGFVIFNELIEVVNELPRYQENIHNKIQAMRAPGKGALARAAESVKTLGEELSTAVEPPSAPTLPERGNRRNAPAAPAGPVPVQIVERPTTEWQYVRDLAQPFLAPLGEFGIVLIFSLFLLIEEHDLRNRLFRLAGVERLNVLTKALDDATKRVSHYLMLQLLVNAAFGAICGFGLYLIGVPYAALWGSVAAILRIVPYAGSLVAGLLPFMLSLAVFDHWMRPFLVVLLFGAIEIITGNLFEPWLYGTHTGISSLALLLATAFWAILWGPAGLILSTPLTVCVVVLGRHIPQLSFLHILLGDEVVLSSEAQMYQRLLAMDEHDARTVADQYLAEHSMLELYDLVVIPALTMAEQDRHKGALDPDRQEFVFLSVREILAEFSENKASQRLEEASAPSAFRRVLCLPANDEADEIAAAMLGQLLEQAGCAALALPRDAALQHMLTLMDPTENDVFCVSSLPPLAFANAITMTRQLQAHFPRTKIVVGVWGFPGEEQRAMQRFHPARPERLVRSFAEAVEFLTGSEPEVKKSLDAAD